jgi:hypothetical protein
MWKFLNFLHGYRTRINYMWISVFSVGWCWECASHLRDYLAVGGRTAGQFVAANSAYALVTGIAALVWPVATWQRTYCVGAPKWGAALYTAGLAILWAVLFSLHLSRPIALGLWLLVPLPLAIPKGDLGRGIVEPVEAGLK